MKDYNYEIANDEISLLEIVDFFKDSWKKILLGGVVGGTLGAGYALIAPSIYQATANIQVAKVANADVEVPATLVEKMKMPTYYSSNTFIECKAENSAEPGKAIANGLNPTLAKNAPIITIKYKEKSAEDAKKCLESVLADVRKNQDEIATPILQTKKNQLANLKQKLEAAEQILKALPSKKPNFDFSDPKFSASTLLLATTLSKENEVKDLRTQINDLEIALAEPQTKSASLTAPIYAPNLRVEPKRTLITLGSGIASGVLVIIFLLGRKTWSNLQKPKTIP